MDKLTTSESTKELCKKLQNKVNVCMNNRNQIRDKSEHATTEHPLDQCTVGILFKMMSLIRQIVINDCSGTDYTISYFTPKEINVYYAVSDCGDLTLKVYITCILTPVCPVKDFKLESRPNWHALTCFEFSQGFSC